VVGWSSGITGGVDGLEIRCRNVNWLIIVPSGRHLKIAVLNFWVLLSHSYVVKMHCANSAGNRQWEIKWLLKEWLLSEEMHVLIFIILHVKCIS
jgi:hypothetical protein